MTNGNPHRPDSPVFDVLRYCLKGFIYLTMGAVYQLFGIPKEKVTLRHAEIYLVATTGLLGTLILAAQHWQPLGWSIVILGNIRILQIISLNLSTLIFDFTPVSDSVALNKRARWHFVAIGFSIVDTVLVFGFMFQFFDRRYGVLSQHFPAFFDYLYYAAMSFLKSSYGDIRPVTLLGRVILVYEAGMAFFFLVFLVSGALGRLRRNSS